MNESGFQAGLDLATMMGEAVRGLTGFQAALGSFSYAQVLEGNAQEAPQREREAFERAVALLKLAEESGPESSEAVEALFFLQRLWTVLTADLASDENALPESLKASLMSIGVWIAREVEAIRTGHTRSFLGLIEINTMICEGLR